MELVRRKSILELNITHNIEKTCQYLPVLFAVISIPNLKHVSSGKSATIGPLQHFKFAASVWLYPSTGGAMHVFAHLLNVSSCTK